MSSRDSFLSAQPGFLNSKPHSASTAPHARRNPFLHFLTTQILAPEKRPGNLAIAWGLGVFTAGIVFARRFGDVIVPVF